jgi:hypothetical protein
VEKGEQAYVNIKDVTQNREISGRLVVHIDKYQHQDT